MDNLLPVYSVAIVLGTIFKSSSPLSGGPLRRNKRFELQLRERFTPVVNLNNWASSWHEHLECDAVADPGARCTNSRSAPRTSPKFVKIIPDKLC